MGAARVGYDRRMASKFAPEQIDYIRRRELQERAAAKRALTVAAKRAHQELAQHYAQLANR